MIFKSIKINYLFLSLFLFGSYSHAQNFTLVGASSSLGGDCYEITPPALSQIGAIWYNNQIDLSQPFDIRCELNLGNLDANGADGMAFVLQTVSSSAIGIYGGGLGFSGFSPSLGVEFDTYENTGNGDLAADHIGILKNGDVNHTGPNSLAGPVEAVSGGTNIEDGNNHKVRFVWEPSTTTLSVYFDCDLRITLSQDIVNTIFGGQNVVYWGFTASTGGAYNSQRICIDQNVLHLAVNSKICSGNSTTLVPYNTNGTNYSWSPATSLDNPNISSPVASPTTTTTYIATFLDDCGFTLTDTQHVEVEDPYVDFTASTVCANDPTVFSETSNAPSGIANWSWDFGDGSPSTQQNPSHTYTNSGNYNVELTVLSNFGCTNSITKPVVVNPLPTATINGAIGVCQDDPEPQITFAGTGGTAPYTFTYSINNGVPITISTTSGNSVTVNAPTNNSGPFTYQLISVTDASSTICSNSATGTATITVYPLPTYTVSKTDPTCGNTDGTITISGLVAGTVYSISYNNSSPVNLSGQTANASGDIMINNLAQGDYTDFEVITPEGCSTKISATLQLIEPNGPTITAPGDVEICDGEDVTLAASNYGSATISWDNGFTDGDQVQPSTTTTYTVTATTSNCTASDQVTITVNPLPTATINGTIDVCQDDPEPQITFTGANGTAPYTFTYTINDGTNTTTETVSTTSGNSVLIDVSTNGAGTFTYVLLSVQDASSTTCSNNQSGTVIITVNSLPTATIDGTTNICQDDTEPQITFTGANGTSPYTFTYTLNDGGNTTTGTVSTTTGNSVTVNASTNDAGTFTYNLVSVEDASSTTCSNAQLGTVTIIVNTLPTATILGPDKVCQYEASNIEFEGANSLGDYTFTYNINNGLNHTITTNGGSGATTPLSTDVPGVFNFELTNIEDPATGCVRTVSQIITTEVIEQPIANFNPDPDQLTSYEWESKMVNESLQADHFFWDFGDGTSPSSEYSPIHEFPNEKTANYSVRLIAYSPNNLCVDTTYKVVQFKNDLLFYVPNSFTPNGDEHNNTFLPVLTAGYDPDDYTLMIFNRWGEMVFESHNAAIGWDGTYEGKIAREGTYIWKIVVQKTLTATREMFTGNVNLIK